MTGPGDSHTTVTNNPGSERYHRTLFRDLRRTLLREQCWEFGEEGIETEHKDQPDAETPQRRVLDFDPVPIRGEPLSKTIIDGRG